VQSFALHTRCNIHSCYQNWVSLKKETENLFAAEYKKSFKGVLTPRLMDVLQNSSALVDGNMGEDIIRRDSYG
jgi:hypothetical protein